MKVQGKSISAPQFIARTGLLVALTLVWQSLRFVMGVNPASTYLIGTLVNLSLVAAALLAGLWSGVVVAVAAPLLALMQGQAQPPMLPAIMLGNLMLVALYALMPRGLWWGTVGIAAVLKFAIIACGMAFVQMGAKSAAFGAVAGAAMTAQVQQLITAVVAGVVALPVVDGVRRALKMSQ